MHFAFWRVRKELEAVCGGVREELDDHLQAINESSRDIGEVRELLSVLDEKLEKVNARIDELYLLLGAEPTPAESALQAFLQLPRTHEEVLIFTGQSPAVVEHLLRCLHFRGVQVHISELRGQRVLCANKDAVKHVQLHNYF